MRIHGGSSDTLVSPRKPSSIDAPASAPSSSIDPPSSSSRDEPPTLRMGALASALGFTRDLSDVLRDYLTEADRKAALAVCEAAASVKPGRLGVEHLPVIAPYVERALGFYGVSEARKAECIKRLRALAGVPPGAINAVGPPPPGPRPPAPSFTTLLAAQPLHEASITIESERDIVQARVAGREICVDLGFSVNAQTKVATAISELARNIWRYAGRGRMTIRAMPDGIEVVARDDGPGIADIDAVLSPRYRSRSGMGVGLQGTRRIMDHFAIVSQPGKGTTVTIRKLRE